jgi:hypothetical protein
MTVDTTLEKSLASSWLHLTENELLGVEFNASDPESLENVSQDTPPNEEPEIEARYDMTGRDYKVQCVYCKFPNHYKGIVVRYPSGSRRLVGRDCALTHHGVDFESKLIDFDAAIERQSSLRRRHTFLAASAEVFREFEALKSHLAVTAHDELLKVWRDRFHDLAAAMTNVVRRGEMLTVDRQIRDEAGERLRKERLGAKFEEERQKAKAAGKSWQMIKNVTETIGPVNGGLFFTTGIAVAKRLGEIQAVVQEKFRVLSSDELKTSQIRTCLTHLSEQRDAVAQECARLDAILSAFEPDNLARIAKWANEKAHDQWKREAAMENRKAGSFRGRFTTDGRSITDAYSRGATASLPVRYHAPKQTLLSTLTRAISIDYELGRDAK